MLKHRFGPGMFPKAISKEHIFNSLIGFQFSLVCRVNWTHHFKRRNPFWPKCAKLHVFCMWSNYPGFTLYISKTSIVIIIIMHQQSTLLSLFVTPYYLNKDNNLGSTHSQIAKHSPRYKSKRCVTFKDRIAHIIQSSNSKWSRVV